MKAVSGKRFARLLEQHGWSLQRAKGSHHIYTKPDVDARISVPIQGNKPLIVGLQRHLMKLAKIPESEL
jgi:predicted RNA binding protein YcfA (HicA-like mRNA interferase family)